MYLPTCGRIGRVVTSKEGVNRHSYCAGDDLIGPSSPILAVALSLSIGLCVVGVLPRNSPPSSFHREKWPKEERERGYKFQDLLSPPPPPHTPLSPFLYFHGLPLGRLLRNPSGTRLHRSFLHARRHLCREEEREEGWRSTWRFWTWGWGSCGGSIPTALRPPACTTSRLPPPPTAKLTRPTTPPRRGRLLFLLPLLRLRCRRRRR